MTSKSVLAHIPKPLIGMNYEPSPSDYVQLPAPEKYGDTDFANDDFKMLWDDSPTGARGDLNNIKALGCNIVKMYNWSAPAPDGYWQRDHKNFLKKCSELGLKVIVPISNYFTGVAYSNRASNPGGPGPDPNLSDYIEQMVNEIYPTYADTVIMWAVGNEYDNSNIGAYGYCEAQDIVQICSYIAAAEQKLRVAESEKLAFTSPVTTAVTPINTSIPKLATPDNIMGEAAIKALLSAFDTNASQLKDRFIASVNSYQIGEQLKTYYSDFPKKMSDLSMFYGELGFSSAGQNGTEQQAKNIYSQFSITVPQATSGGFFLGSCCFEYTNELWKGPSGSTETEFGLIGFVPGKYTTANEGNHPPAPVSGAEYPVDDLQDKKAVKYFQAAVQGKPEPAE